MESSQIINNWLESGLSSEADILSATPKFPKFYEIRNFIAFFTQAHHWPLF
jgi:hypothetical protein